jgi:hypothetical protein
MKLLLIGCEYAGTTTLAKGILRWGESEMGAYFGLIHDHWKVPHVTGHWPIDTDAFPTAEERRDLVDLSPKFKEQMQRHSLYYHIQPGAFDKGKEEQQGFYPDYLAIGMHIEDAVYGPLYFGYGGEGQPAPRDMVKQTVERALLKFAPEFVLVHVKAYPTVIRQRMADAPHDNPVVQDEDVELVLRQFEEAYQSSAIQHKLEIDTSNATVEDTVAEFITKFEPYLTDDDRERKRESQARRGQGGTG